MDGKEIINKYGIKGPKGKKGRKKGRKEQKQKEVEEEMGGKRGNN